MCVLTLTIAGPVRTYFAQRTEMKQLAASEAALRAQIADLEAQKAKLADPVYIAAQARERLGFVMPGDISLPGSAAAGRRRGDRWRCEVGGGAQQRPLVHLAVAHHRRCAHGPPPPPPTTPTTSPTLPLPPPPEPVPVPLVVDPADLDAVTRQLGREPRNVLEIAYRCPNGEPAVVKTSPRLPDGTPFPTLYHLTHPVLTAAASRQESEGLMRDDRPACRGPAAGRGLPARTSRISPSRTRSNRWGPTSPAAACPTGSGAYVLIAACPWPGPLSQPFGDEALAVLAVEPAMAGITGEGDWSVENHQVGATIDCGPTRSGC